MERYLKSITEMKKGMIDMKRELASYVESYDEDGIHVELQGDGIIKNLEFNDGTSPSIVAKVINNANAKLKNYILMKINNITPPELREAEKNN